MQHNVSAKSAFGESLAKALCPARRRRKPKARPQGHINPALLQFNGIVAKKNLAKDVRRWIYSSGMSKLPSSVPLLASLVIDEARGRILHFHETPLVALAHSAVCNTVLYRDTDAKYAELCASAQAAFSPQFPAVQ